MGIKDLFKCLRSKGLAEEVIYSRKYKNTCMAVDAYNLFHINMYHGHMKSLENVSDPMTEPPPNYEEMFEPTSYLINKRLRLSETVKFIIDKFIIPLLRNNIFPLFVFDGDVREVKSLVVKKRSDQKSTSFSSFFAEREKILSIVDPVDRAVRISNLVNKLKYCYRVSSTDVDIFKDILRELGFEPLTAKYDGEELCCSLVHSGKASLVYSRDSDCLTYGIPTLITSIQGVSWGKMKGYNLPSVLRSLGKPHCQPFMISGNMKISMSMTHKTSRGDRHIVKCDSITVEQDGRKLCIRPPDGYEHNIVVKNVQHYVEIVVGDGDCPPFIIEGLTDTPPSNDIVSATSEIIKICGNVSFESTNTINIDVMAQVCIDMIDIRTHLPIESFIDYCILLGTDFNSRIPGYGMVKALKLIEAYGTVPNIARNKPNLNYENLNYNETRQLFITKDYQDCIKEGKCIQELIPSGSTKLISRYRLSAENEMIHTAYTKSGDMLGGDMLGGDMLGGDMLGGDMLGGDMLGVKTLTIHELMARMRS